MLCHPPGAHIPADAAQVHPVAAAIFTVNAIGRKHLRASRAAIASCAALLLPFLAAADSQVDSSSGRGALKASAHLDFKIIIPRVLSMDMADGLEGPRGAQTVAIFTNSHNATLAAAIPASDLARGNIILSSAARKVISQSVDCALGAPASRARMPDALVICTASMP